MYQDGWSANNTNYDIGAPNETSDIFLQIVELDANTNSDLTDYKAIEGSQAIQLNSEQITILKAANGTEEEGFLILPQMHMNLQSGSDLIEEPISENNELAINYNFSITFNTSGIAFP